MSVLRGAWLPHSAGPAVPCGAPAPAGHGAWRLGVAFVSVTLFIKRSRKN